jgi:uncharacterized protein Yka (UPF0111/DUF47 family)
MLAKFLPRQDNFFDLFQKISACVVKAAEELCLQVNALPNADDYSKHILQYKKEAGASAQQVFTLLHKTFITPFDRYDIHRLNAKIYDTINMINVTTQRFPIYHIDSVPKDVVVLAEICLQSTQLMQTVIGHLREIITACSKIKDLESEADEILLKGIGTLMDEESDIKRLLKLREIYELLESITDRCQEVAFILEGIVLEYS